MELQAYEYFEIARGADVHTETILITPIVARAWLERNEVNRDVSESYVDDLAWDLKNGKWVLTHQGVGFNKNEQLVDGQHRLLAIIKADTPALMRVTFNLDVTYHAAIDVGRARRVHDVLSLTLREVAICNALMLLESRSHHRGTSAMVNDVYAQHEHAIDWAESVFPIQRGITANLLAAHVYAHPTAPTKIEAFAKQFVSYTGATGTDPVVVLRKYVERTKLTSSARRDLTLAALRCMQAYCEGESVTRLVVNEAGAEYFHERRAQRAGGRK